MDVMEIGQKSIRAIALVIALAGTASLSATPTPAYAWRGGGCEV